MFLKVFTRFRVLFSMCANCTVRRQNAGSFPAGGPGSGILGAILGARWVFSGGILAGPARRGYAQTGARQVKYAAGENYKKRCIFSLKDC